MQVTGTDQYNIIIAVNKTSQRKGVRTIVVTVSTDPSFSFVTMEIVGVGESSGADEVGLTVGFVVEAPLVPDGFMAKAMYAYASSSVSPHISLGYPGHASVQDAELSAGA